MAAPKVFVAGPVSWNHLVLLDRLPEARPHTVFARGHRMALGGTSAGKALNLAQLGAEVTLRTVVGDDEFGRAILDTLATAGVEVIAETVPSTERHLNLMDAEGGRLSIYLELPRPGLPRHDPLPALRAADAAVLDLADHVRPLLGTTVPIWCDLHDYDGANPYHQDFLTAATHVFLNDDGFPDRAELRAFLTGRVAAGAKTAVATLGADGAMAASGDAVHHVPAAPVARIVDTNGAGDAFFAGFLMAHLGGADVPTALSAGAAQAARCLASPNLAP